MAPVLLEPTATTPRDTLSAQPGSCPMNTPVSDVRDTLHRPIMPNRTLSSPPLSPVSHSQPFQSHSITSLSWKLLTPPTSPRNPDKRSVSADNLLNTLESESDSQRTVQDIIPPPLLLEYPFSLAIQRTSSGEPLEYGRGAWSVVYKAIRCETAAFSLGIPSPASSPVSASPQVLAVKSPIRRDAHAIIRDEALTLSHIVSVAGNTSRVVPFLGFISATNSLVMAAVPLSLSVYVEGAKTRATLTMQNMFEPVIGIHKWQDLAQHVVSSLAWLHDEARVVHGDIKPHNILLRPRKLADCPGIHDAPFPFDALFADFSSSYLLSFNEPSPNALSALTPEYTAPELLSALTRKNESSVPTADSDVFSLAVTLITAATGDLKVYPSPNQMQRLYMAKSDGNRVLDHVRNGPQGSRVPRRGMVEQVVERAVLKRGMGRVSAPQWVEIVEAVFDSGEPEKKGRL